MPILKAGIEVVRDFISDLHGDTALDHNVVTILQELHQQDKLTKTKLLQALADQRKENSTW
jgi:hypothetical protein